MSCQFKIRAKLETSSHDGYCSGEGCEYNCSVVTHITQLSSQDIPANFSTDIKGKLTRVQLSQVNWIKYMPVPVLGSDNLALSGYCELSEQCIECGLDCHDYRYTILSVEAL